MSELKLTCPKCYEPYNRDKPSYPISDASEKKRNRLAELEAERASVLAEIQAVEKDLADNLLTITFDENKKTRKAIDDLKSKIEFTDQKARLLRGKLIESYRNDAAEYLKGLGKDIAELQQIGRKIDEDQCQLMARLEVLGKDAAVNGGKLNALRMTAETLRALCVT